MSERAVRILNYWQILKLISSTTLICNAHLQRTNMAFGWHQSEIVHIFAYILICSFIFFFNFVSLIM